MIRTLMAAAGVAVATSTASAGLIGFEMRESAALNGGAAAAGIANARVIRMFAKFDGAGGFVDNQGFNSVVQVTTGDLLQNLPGGGSRELAPLTTQQGVFHQEAGGAATGLPPAPFIIGIQGSVSFDSYVSIGALVDEATDPDPPAIILPEPLVWTDTSLSRSWALVPETSNTFAADEGNGMFSVFLGQFTLVGGAGGGDNLFGGAFDNGSLTIANDAFEGELAIFDSSGGVSFVNFIVPTPGALALFGIAGLAAARRRRA